LATCTSSWVFGCEGAGEMPRTHAGLISQILDRQWRIEMVAHPDQQRPETTVRRLQFQQRGELRLAAATVVVDNKLARGVLRDTLAKILRHHCRGRNGTSVVAPKDRFAVPRESDESP
jgi:hypothetical protein